MFCGLFISRIRKYIFRDSIKRNIRMWINYEENEYWNKIFHSTSPNFNSYRKDRSGAALYPRGSNNIIIWLATKPGIVFYWKYIIIINHFTYPDDVTECVFRGRLLLLSLPTVIVITRIQKRCLAIEY